MRRVLVWLSLGMLFTAVMTYVPPVVAHKLRAKLESSQVPATRLAFTPTSWPDPGVTWRKAIPGFEELTSMRGFGVEHMMIVTRYRAGWPFATLEGFTRVEYLYDMGTRKTNVLDQGAEATAFRWGTNVPTGLRVGGLLANLALFTLGAACFSAPRAVRALIASRRRKSGRCERCAYPLASGPVCPECGAPTRTVEPSREI